MWQVDFTKIKPNKNCNKKKKKWNEMKCKKQNEWYGMACNKECFDRMVDI